MNDDDDMWWAKDNESMTTPNEQETPLAQLALEMGKVVVQLVYDAMSLEDKNSEEIKAYWTELKGVLVSMDEQRIRAFHNRYFPTWGMSKDPEVFWGAVHKMITGMKDIDIETRRKSKAWLTERGYRSYDDGDL